MDKDTNRSLARQGVYRHAENLRFQTNDSDDGVGKNIKGTTEVSDVTENNTDLKCIGAYFNEDKDVIYYKLASSNGMISIDAEYDICNDTTSIILKDTRGVLKYDKKGYVTGWNEIDGIQIWSEFGNNPRRINTERAKGYGEDGFTEDDIKLIVHPPLQKLRISLQNTNTSSQQENHIEDIMVAFSYRYRYLDGEYSALAPFTEFAFEPKRFDYDFAEQSNRSMINQFNQVLLEFNTGSDRVTEIQLVWVRTGSNAGWIIDDFNKDLLGYGDNEIQSFVFDNNKTYRSLPQEALLNHFDNVPLTNKAQTIIDGRVLLANYIENYDIKDDEGNEIRLDYSLNLIALDNTVEEERPLIDPNTGNVTTELVEVASLIPKKTAKSNRDYEVTIVYGDDDGRITTLLSSKTNTLYIPNKNSVTENKIQVQLKHKPPFWATYYRFFIKQNKKNYEQLIPTLFYEDGVFRWIKLENADKDKIKEGDYLIIKSDTQGFKEELVRAKVLEITEQPKNFLQPDIVNDSIVERSGLYFKIKPENFRIDIDDYDSYELRTYDTSANRHDNPVSNQSSYISEAHFYGQTLNDLNTSGAYTGGTDNRLRFLVEIDSVGATDTFRWSIDDGANYLGQNIPIVSGQAFTLQDGVQITFDNQTGHSIFDNWNINAVGNFGIRNDSKAYAFFRTQGGINDTITSLSEERIFAGARILFRYDEYNEQNVFFEIDKIASSNYDNIQEWFYKENIYNEISSLIPINDIWFIRGVLRNDGSATRIEGNQSDGIMTMVIESQGTQNNDLDSRAKIRTFSSVIQSDGDNRIVFETEPPRQPEDIYFEVGKNYRIVNGFHSAITNDFQTEIGLQNGDTSQSNSSDLLVTLEWFNAFSYGNAVESYKIRDEFNTNGLEVGLRPLTTTRERYQQVHRTADITWSDIYNDESDYNGLSSFNLALLNFVKLDKEDASIQKLWNINRDLLVLQEDAVGVMPYNKQIVNQVDGGRIIGVSTNVLDRNSYRPYASGKHGISRHPESFVQDGSRFYFTDQMRGDIIRLSNNGISTINENLLEYYSSDIMYKNKLNQLVAGFDTRHGEYLLYIPTEESTLAFKEGVKGFPNFFTFEPDFILNANNQCYAWKNGVMYVLNSNETRNNFFGDQKESKLRFFVNEDFSTEKIWKAMGLESTHAWLVNLKTRLTSSTIEKSKFLKKEDYWYSDITPNTNGETESSNIQGLGVFPIINGEISTDRRPVNICIGDEIISSSLLFQGNKILDITEDKIILEDKTTTVPSFLMYRKNQNIDGNPLRGDVLEVEMISDETEEVTIRAVNTEVAKSFNS